MTMLDRGKRPSDRRLLDRAQRGDGEAFAVFYRRHCELVLAYFLRRVRQPDIAADLMMEVFAVVWLAIYDGAVNDAEEPVAWIFGIARNKLVDSYRKRSAEDRARRRLELMEPVALDDEDLLRIDQLTDEAHVMPLLERLPKGQRDLVWARIVEREDYPGIADHLQTSELVVRKRVSRALKTLRMSMEET